MMKKRETPEKKSLVSGIDLLMHDVKQPLLSISRLTTMLHEEMTERAGDIPDRVVQIIDRIEMSCDSVLKMIGPLLEMAILGDCEIEPNPPTEIDLEDVINRSSAISEAAIERFHGRVEMVGDFPKIVGNEGRWMSVFQNIIKNGLKYNESSTPTVKMVGFPDHIMIIDNGIGIPRGLWNDVFSLSFRIHEDGRFGDGTGAGLYIARKFVEWDGGSIKIIESSDEGTTFKIDLPERIEI